MFSRRRRRETVTPSPLDASLGLIDQDFASQEAHSQEARDVFESIRPEVDKALQAIQKGRANQFKERRRNLDVRRSVQGLRASYCVDVFAWGGQARVTVEMSTYLGGQDVVPLFREWYEQQYGYVVEETYGITCARHGRFAECDCKKQRDPERTIVYIKLP